MVSHIAVKIIPNCTWVLDGTTFFCSHDDVELTEYVEDYMGINGPYQVESQGYSCVECGEPVDVDEYDEDESDYYAELSLMETLNSR